MARSDAARVTPAAAAPAPAGRPAPSRYAYVFLVLLALQFGWQPLVTARFTSPHAIKTTVVMACEVVKAALALSGLALSSGGMRGAFRRWSLASCLGASGVAAGSYSAQNVLIQVGYQALDSITFNCLNQTKVLATALMTWLLLGVRQSAVQMLALLMLVAAALLLSTGHPHAGGAAGSGADSWATGIAAVLAASALSGLGSTLAQRATQVQRRLPALFNVEMAAVSTIILASSLLLSPDGTRVAKEGFFAGWSAGTLVPVITNAVGGLLVAQVTTSLGGVSKGFAIVAGLVITGVTQAVAAGQLPSGAVLLALGLVATSTALHSRYPPKQQQKGSAKKAD